VIGVHWEGRYSVGGAGHAGHNWRRKNNLAGGSIRMKGGSKEMSEEEEKTKQGQQMRGAEKERRWRIDPGKKNSEGIEKKLSIVRRWEHNKNSKI